MCTNFCTLSKKPSNRIVFSFLSNVPLRMSIAFSVCEKKLLRHLLERKVKIEEVSQFYKFFKHPILQKET